MTKDEAKNLVFKTFEQSFDESRFLFFIKNILSNLDESKSQTWSGNYIPESFRNAIKFYKRIGQYSDHNKNVIDVLIVNVKRDITLERARSLQRNFIARHLKQRNHEAALVAFYTDDYSDWRFSLIVMDINLTKTKVEIDFTPAKRYSFLVGVNERSHTAQNQFVKLLTVKEEKPTLDKIEDAFNIETVTKEFFLEYRNLLIRIKIALDKVIENDPKLKKEFNFKGVNSVDFSKKLLGQIIFLYFLQKKGWFGVERNSSWGTGSKKFLRELVEKKHGEYGNFFNEILEPLFYEALRNDRSHDYHYYSRFNCKIPFLNGGLFDPIRNYDWVRTDIILPNEIFSNSHKTKEGDIGDGLLDIFDRYNFTVIEDEPLEKEVAIDPELLGKAYEKFNAIRPDNFNEYVKVLKSGKKGEENKFNKQYGVFYTPREIVHYMCRESLINYLASEFSEKTDAYQKITTEQLDAFGNTARKGQLHLETEHKSTPNITKEDIETLINYGELLGENEAIVEAKGKETDTYYYKLPESIRKNAKLIDDKLADVLICDPAVGSGAFPVGMMHEIVVTRNLLSIFIKEKNRPIYYFKRECIEKSLYGVDIDSGAVEIAKLRLWLSLVVDENDINNIKPLPNLDYKIVCGNSLLDYPYNPLGLDEIELLKEEFIFETNTTKKNKLREQIDSAIFGLYKNSEKSLGYKVSLDFKINFSEVFRRKNGFDIVIANPPYVSALELKKILPQNVQIFLKKNFETAKGTIDLYVYFFERGLKILKEDGVLAYISPNRYLSVSYGEALRKFIYNNASLKKIVDLSDVKVFAEASTYPIISFLLKCKQKEYEILIGKYRNTIADVDYKITTSQKLNLLEGYIWGFLLNDKIKITEKVISQSIPLNKVCFINATSTTSEADMYHPIINETNGYRLINTGTIDRYCTTWGTEFLTDKGKKYLKPYLPINSRIISKNRHKLYSSPKIIFAKIALRAEAYYDEKGIYASINTNCLHSFSEDINPKYVLSYVNSKLFQYTFECFFDGLKMQGGYLLYSAPNLMSIYIKIVDKKYQKTFVKLVDDILKSKQSDNCADIKEIEDQIDIMIYKLYNLTYEEVKIIDPEIEQIISRDEYERFEIV